MLDQIVSNEIFWVYIAVILVVLLVVIIYLYKYNAPYLYIHIIISAIFLFCTSIMMYWIYYYTDYRLSMNIILGVLLFSLVMWAITIDQGERGLYMSASAIVAILFFVMSYCLIGYLAFIFIPYFIWLLFAYLTNTVNK